MDGNWAAWKAWGRCSRTCGGGTQVRSRTCTNPPPAFRGLRCPGKSTETQSCNEDIPCPGEESNSFQLCTCSTPLFYDVMLNVNEEEIYFSFSFDQGISMQQIICMQLFGVSSLNLNSVVLIV